MKHTTKSTGDKFEHLACQELQAHQFDIIATNWAVAKVGEIDIIARNTTTHRHAHPTLICVEVRARRHSQFAQASETVTVAKQKRIIATMQHFLQAHPEYANDEVRFDVMAFDVAVDGNWTLEWIPSAFVGE